MYSIVYRDNVNRVLLAFACKFKSPWLFVVLISLPQKTDTILNTLWRFYILNNIFYLFHKFSTLSKSVYHSIELIFLSILLTTHQWKTLESGAREVGGGLAPHFFVAKLDLTIRQITSGRGQPLPFFRSKHNFS